MDRLKKLQALVRDDKDACWQVNEWVRTWHPTDPRTEEERLAAIMTDPSTLVKALESVGWKIEEIASACDE